MKITKIDKRILKKTLKVVAKHASKKLLKFYERDFAKGGYRKEKGGNGFVRWAKRKKSYPHPILKKTKRLQKSFRSGIVRFGFEIVNTTPYAQWHQEGTDNMAARPVLTWSKKSEKIVVDEVKKQVLKLLGL